MRPTLGIVLSGGGARALSHVGVLEELVAAGLQIDRVAGVSMGAVIPRSFMSGSTELRSGQLVIARHGPLWEAVGFSICLPVIGPPQVRGRELFIDGSLVDNLPVRTMAEMGEAPIIAVHVKAAFERSANSARAENGQPRHDRERPPSIGETLTRVLPLGSRNTSEAAGRHADLLITPQTHGVGLLEFHQLDAAREAGRIAAREALAAAPRVLFS